MQREALIVTNVEQNLVRIQINNTLQEIEDLRVGRLTDLLNSILSGV